MICVVAATYYVAFPAAGYKLCISSWKSHVGWGRFFSEPFSRSDWLDAGRLVIAGPGIDNGSSSCMCNRWIYAIVFLWFARWGYQWSSEEIWRPEPIFYTLLPPFSAPGHSVRHWVILQPWPGLYRGFPDGRFVFGHKNIFNSFSIDRWWLMKGWVWDGDVPLTQRRNFCI